MTHLSGQSCSSLALGAGWHLSGPQNGYNFIYGEINPSRSNFVLLFTGLYASRADPVLKEITIVIILSLQCYILTV